MLKKKSIVGKKVAAVVASPPRGKSEKKKKTKPKQKKPSKAAAEKAFEKKVEKVVQKVFDHPSQAVENLIHKVSAKLDLKANSGNVNAVALSDVAIADMLGAWVDNITRSTPICVSTIGTAFRVWPIELYLFGYIALLLHIRRVGQLGGDTLGTLPQFLNDLSIPVPLAKFFEYLGKYRKNDQNLMTLYNLPPNFMNSLLNKGYIDPAASYPFPVSQNGLVYDNMYLGGIKELVADRNWTNITVSAWCQTRLQGVANAFRSLDIAVVPLSGIPEEAPSIDAYACRGKDRESNAVLAGRVFAVVPIHDEDLATIFSQGRTLQVYSTWLSKVIPPPMIDLNLGFATLTTEQYLAFGFMYFMSGQNEFKAGPVKRVYKLMGGPQVTTFAWSVKYISDQAVKTCITQSYKQLQAKIPNFSDKYPFANPPNAASAWRILYALEVLFLVHLLHRVNTSNPVTNLALPLSNTASSSSTAFHTDGVTDGVPLLSLMTEFIESLGVVVSEGSMIFPRFIPITRSPGTTWGSGSFAGNLIMMSWRGLNYASGVTSVFPFPFEGTSTEYPNINTGSFIWDSSFNGNYVVSPPLFPYPIQIPSATLFSFVGLLKSALGQQYYQNISMALTCGKSGFQHRFGKLSQMLSVLEAPAGNSQLIVLTPVDNNILYAGAPEPASEGKEEGAIKTNITTGPLYFFYAQTTVVGSSVIMDRHELMNAIVLASERIDNIDLVNPSIPYLCRIVGADSLSFTSQIVDMTTQPGQDNGDLMPNPTRLPNGQFVPTRMVEKKNNQPSVWDSAIHKVGSDIIEGGAGIAAGLACDIIPIVGELISPACAAGASSLVSTFMSRSSTYANGRMDSSAGVDHKARIAAVKAGVAQVGKAVGASSDAIGHTMKALSGVAAAHTYGIMRPALARVPVN